jgi:hypothetical protein
MMVALAPPSNAEAPARTPLSVIERALPSQTLTAVKGLTSLQGVDITAPSDRETYATNDAMIAVLQDGQNVAAFGLPSTAVVRDDGSVLMVRTDGMMAGLAAPWAKDARGASLRTWYTVVGNRLTQHVDTAGATYPIAADPKLTFGWGIYLNITGAEIKAIATAVIGAGGLTIYTVCNGKIKLPSLLATVVRLLCPLLSGVTVYAILNTIVNLWRNQALHTTWCYQKRIVGPSTGWYTVPFKNCV